MKKKIRRLILILIFVACGILFVIRFGGPSILRFYIETAVGDCRKIPVLCIIPEEELNNPPVDDLYLSGLLHYKFPEVEIQLPKGFTVIKQRITRVYYKKWRKKAKGATVYLLHEPANFFVRLFPQFNKQGINNDYDFISRLMHAKVTEINTVSDAFFVVMKGLFIPDLGDQANVKIVHFNSPELRGFIGYNLGDKENYFDCNLVSNTGFYKVYIKDKNKLLDLEKVTAILSTMKNTPAEAKLVK